MQGVGSRWLHMPFLVSVTLLSQGWAAALLLALAVDILGLSIALEALLP